MSSDIALHSLRRFVKSWLLTLLLIVSVSPAAAWAEGPLGCGPLENGFGPFDYNDPANLRWVKQVENFHFSPEQENLIVGRSGDLALDIDYTLRAIPNHPRALWAMARFQLKNGYKAGARYYTADCYFDRALRWRSEDPMVWMVYGMYLQKKHDSEGAVKKFERAVELDPNSGEAQYNLGLAYANLEQYEAALEHAKKAYALGYPLPGLRNILIKKGYWKDEQTAGNGAP